MLTTCNPNTLYFSTGSLFGFRLTSKIDPTQSRSMSWEVRFASSTVGNTGTYTEQNPPSPLSQGGTGTTSTGTTDSGATNTVTTSSSSGFTSSGVTFPDIIPTFQNYTNTNNSGDTLTCVTSPCRVNFTLDPIFTGSLLAKNYTCQITYGTGVYDSCNPPQLYPIGT
jgi:hypothetical protein